ncbi:aspartokinase [Vibrio variabilis]|uniref:Aspartokinase n=1 Tax=Vibrio variabilis TaxID=990271 RepID=A0ABQ0J6A0_9VIBR|nr:aspartokinase [Vibrio variabilis]
MAPLAFEAQADQSRLRLAYTAEIASGALTELQDLAIEAEIKLKEGYSMLAAVGAGVTKMPTTVLASISNLNTHRSSSSLKPSLS